MKINLGSLSDEFRYWSERAHHRSEASNCKASDVVTVFATLNDARKKEAILCEVFIWDQSIRLRTFELLKRRKAVAQVAASCHRRALRASTSVVLTASYLPHVDPLVASIELRNCQDPTPRLQNFCGFLFNVPLHLYAELELSIMQDRKFARRDVNDDV